MTRSTSKTKALQSHSERRQQLLSGLLERPVNPNCFRRQTFHVLNSDFGSARLWSTCLKCVLHSLKLLKRLYFYIYHLKIRWRARIWREHCPTSPPCHAHRVSAVTSPIKCQADHLCTPPWVTPHQGSAIRWLPSIHSLKRYIVNKPTTFFNPLPSVID